MSAGPAFRRLAGALARRLRSAGPPDEHHLAFFLPGAGRAWPGMGQELYRTRAAFRESVEASGAVAGAILGCDPAALFRGPAAPAEEPGTARRDSALQAGMFQIALADLWRGEGIAPAGVLGTSAGEIPTRYVAGALTRDDCSRALAFFAHAVSRSPAPGVRFTLAADPAAAQRLCRTAPAPLYYLGSTSPELSYALAARDDAEAVRAHLEPAIRHAAPTRWSHHSPLHRLDREWLDARLRGIATRPASIPVYSAAAGGKLAPDAPFDASFIAWVATRPFHMDEALAAALEDGFDLFVGVGAEAGGGAALAQAALGRSASFVASARAGAEDAAWRHAVERVRSARLSAPPAPRASAATLDLTLPREAARKLESYAELRRQGPVHFMERRGYWLVVGFDAARDALAHSGALSSRMPLLRDVDPVLLGADRPEHTAVRRLLAPHLSHAALARHAGVASATAERLLQPLAEGNELDVVLGFAGPLADIAAAHLLGLPHDDSAALSERALDARGHTRAIYRILREPIADLAPRSALYAALRGGGLAEEEALSVVRLVWIAATTEPKRVLSAAVLHLLRHPEIREQVRAKPALLPRYVDEMLRLHPPEVITRVALAEVELGGTRVPAGATVHIAVPAANRDPARFPDPDAIRLDRSVTSHLAFGGGIHRCIGAGVARAQTVAALAALFRVAPGFRVVQPLCTVRHAQRSPVSPIRELVIGA
jgi:cytochrome P450